MVLGIYFVSTVWGPSGTDHGAAKECPIFFSFGPNHFTPELCFCSSGVWSFLSPNWLLMNWRCNTFPWSNLAMSSLYWLSIPHRLYSRMHSIIWSDREIVTKSLPPFFIFDYRQLSSFFFLFPFGPTSIEAVRKSGYSAAGCWWESSNREHTNPRATIFTPAASSTHD